MIRSTSFSKHFFSKLPVIVRNDIEYSVACRKKRKGATMENIARFTDEMVKNGLFAAPLIENKYPFADSRINNKRDLKLDHHILMNDSSIEHLSWRLMESHMGIMASMNFDEECEKENRSYLEVLKSVYIEMRDSLLAVYLSAPTVKKKHKTIEDAERELECAIRRMLDEEWITKRFLFLRAQYIEFSQIALDRVGEKKHQQKFISKVSFANWMQKQRDAENFLKCMSVLNMDTGEAFDLNEVVKRTTANPENRRIEMMVRARGNEELAVELGYEGVFINWTLPSKYHRNSKKWGGYSVKDGHINLMDQWKRARARLAKDEVDYFGFRVSEPHKDGTSHAHMFLFCRPNQKALLVRHLQEVAIEEDREELGEDITPRFLVKFADPSQGSATAYIAKYISKNINGAHMPSNDAEKGAYLARAWASTHRIKQFQGFGNPSVGLWRSLRKVDAKDTAFDVDLEELRQAADSSKWMRFCQLAHEAKTEYQEGENKYGEKTYSPIGFLWRNVVVNTKSAIYSIVKTKDVPRLASALALKKKRSFAPWSTENKCNSDLIEALQRITGWSVDGVQCLIKPLQSGAKVSIDKHSTISLRNNRLLQS